ncbi:MAG: DNA integrity scanning protein DisA nucleotide-binding domain protein [Desulfobacterales bacterium]|nr:DNA integrity scanning protein DisA nucleotide-binding domain protein [Desulfobacterales bacterium]
MLDMINTIFPNIRWQDIVDVTLNSYILFRLYILFKGTNFFRIVMGIVFLWFFQKTAVTVGLIVTSWALQGITAIAAFIIIIVFRNEIYVILQTQNLKSIFWGKVNKSHQHATSQEIIIDSVYELSQKRCGALIVFPGKEDVRKVTQNGLTWNGQLSKEMILSIFWHNNPVHDGASIIEDNRVTTVGVILPLSQRNDLPSHFGTRHRAAAGLAETTDAMTLLVSEETGNIVVTKGTNITVIHQKEVLTNLLESHIGIGDDQPNRKFFAERLKTVTAAIVSFIFIGSIWFSFTRVLDTLIALEVPINLINRKSGLEIINTSTNSVRLHVGGSNTLIKSLRPDQVQIEIDLSQTGIGHSRFEIMESTIKIPPGIQLKGVNPKFIDITLDVSIQKELPVQIDWVGRLPDHLILESVSYIPETMKVIAWSVELKPLSTIYSEKVNLSTIEKSGQLILKPALETPSMRIAPDSFDSITVNYVIKERESFIIQEGTLIPIQ